MSEAKIALPESCEALLAGMVAHDTVNERYGGKRGGDAALAAWLEGLTAQWGLKSRRYPVAAGGFNLLISHEPTASADWLLCESHLDTVGVSGMTVDPFTVHVTDDRLYGRGVCDTKGSGAAMLWALRDVARSGRAKLNVGVLFVIDEEAGMTGASSFARDVLPTWPGRLRGIFVGEPTGLRPVIAHNGVVRWTTATQGLAAHSADPSRGRSAITAMVRLISHLEQTYLPLVASRRHALTGKSAASINVIRGGTQVNIIPERCEIDVDRRTLPGETAVTVLEERDRVIAKLVALTSNEIVVSHTEAFVIPPLAPQLNAELLALITPSLEQHGGTSTGRGAAYVTDASYYAAAGVPAIVLGPGEIAQAHTCDEWIARSQIEQATRLFASLLSVG